MRWILTKVAAVMLAITVPAYAGPRIATIGQPAPDFAVDVVTGGRVSLADLKGQVVVLNLWATWCTPCKAEMPMLDEMQRKLTGHGVRIIGVVVEDDITAVRVRNVGKVLGYSLAMYMSHANAYPTDGEVPTTYVIDRKGVVRYIQKGAYSRESFAAMIVPLVNEPAS